MSNFDLLSAVQPEGGWFAVVGISGGQVRQYMVETRDEVDTLVSRLTKKQVNVFYGVAKYRTGENRKKDNVLALKTLWVDIDCGDNKDYLDQAEGLAALQRFTKTIGLPRPAIVNSGRGLHAYWPLEESVDRAAWEQLSDRLHELCVTHELHADPACFEAARILRVPGTRNFKDDPPREVELLSAGKATSLTDMRDILGVKNRPAPALPAKRGLSPLAQKLQENFENSFAAIVRKGAKGTGCAQIMSCIEDRKTISEPRWFNGLSIAKFCRDRARAVALLSEDHPDYDPVAVDQKLQHIKGPHTCVEFEKQNPGLCAQCPHFGKIKSPIVLGKVLAQAVVDGVPLDLPPRVEDDTPPELRERGDKEYAEDTGVWDPPRSPSHPFAYGLGGCILFAPDGANEEEVEADSTKEKAVVVYDHPVYVAKLMEDPELGGVAVVRHKLPHDGTQDFVVPQRAMADISELHKVFASKNIVSTRRNFDKLALYIIMSVQELQKQKQRSIMRSQFGWVEDDTKFVVGSREISGTGELASAPSKATKALSRFLEPAGSLEKWKEVWELYNTEGLEAEAWAAATAFGAPLLKFSGQQGALINLIYPYSGTGKTTILRMVNSVWGRPLDLCMKKDDTFVSKTHNIGVLNNLPATFDEMTNTEPQQLSELAYLITQGKGKERMKASTNELRENNTTWCTMAVCSSNSSFYEKLTSLKTAPEGEMMRIIELTINRTSSSIIDRKYGMEMFDHQLMENYGWAGPIFAKYIVSHRDEARALLRNTRNALEEAVNIQQKERFWSAAISANIAGIILAKRAGLCDWDVSRIFRWACKMVLELRNDTELPTDADVQFLGEFIIDNIPSILVVDGAADGRSNMNALPLIKPTRELKIRYEPDTKLVFVTCKAFREACAVRHVSYKDTLATLTDKGLLLRNERKRITKGLGFLAPAVMTLVFDGTNPRVFNFNNISEVREETLKQIDAGGED